MTCVMPDTGYATTRFGIVKETSCFRNVAL